MGAGAVTSNGCLRLLLRDYRNELLETKCSWPLPCADGPIDEHPTRVAAVGGWLGSPDPFSQWALFR